MDRTIMGKVAERLLRHSPADNCRLLRAKLSPSVPPANTLAPGLTAERQTVIEYLAWRAARLTDSVVLVGPGTEAGLLAAALARAGKRAELLPWAPTSRGAVAGRVPPGPDVVICPWPASPEDWGRVAALRSSLPNRVLTFQELLLPLGVLAEGRRRLDFRTDTLAESLSYYAAGREMGPMREVDRLYPIAGRRVIELGPLDGYQTAALVNLGAASVTCIEARAQNALKTLAAKAAFGWRNVEVVVDDFHNVSSANFGTYDLAVAHGVYYHSCAPFVLFENLFSLAGRIFFGGYIATDDFPETGYVSLEHREHQYQAKPHADGHGIDQGVNPTAFYLTGEALRRLFANGGYELLPLPSEEQRPGQPPGRYLRFLAARREARPHE